MPGSILRTHELLLSSLFYRWGKHGAESKWLLIEEAGVDLRPDSVLSTTTLCYFPIHYLRLDFYPFLHESNVPITLNISRLLDLSRAFRIFVSLKMMLPSSGTPFLPSFWLAPSHDPRASSDKSSSRPGIISYPYFQPLALYLFHNRYPNFYRIKENYFLFLLLPMWSYFANIFQWKRLHQYPISSSRQLIRS